MILGTEMIIVPNAELISQIPLCIWIYRQGIINKVSIWWFTLAKKPQILLRKIFQTHTDDLIESDYSLIDTKPLDIYSGQELYTEDTSGYSIWYK